MWIGLMVMSPILGFCSLVFLIAKAFGKFPPGKGAVRYSLHYLGVVMLVVPFIAGVVVFSKLFSMSGAGVGDTQAWGTFIVLGVSTPLFFVGLILAVSCSASASLHS